MDKINQMVSILAIVLLFLVIGVNSFTISANPIKCEETTAVFELLEMETTEEEIPDTVSAIEPELIFMGDFYSAAYCGCDLCCGEGRRKLTYSGTAPTADYTVAADLEELNLGDELLINGQTYIVEDNAGQKKGRWVNIYFDSHEDALEYGTKTIQVYLVNKESAITQENLLGMFEITGYCRCEICCGDQEEGALTYQETIPKAEYTVAADPAVIPLGTRITVDGKTYVVEDIGGAIKGNRLDIYFDTHEEAVIYGRKHKNVYLATETD